MRRVASFWLVCMVVTAVLIQPSAQSGEFREAFENPGTGNNYGFAGKAFPVIPSGRTITHRPTGGFDGTGGAEIEVAGCTGCNTSENQGNIGWDTPPMGGTYAPDATRWIRWRHKMLTHISPGAQKFVIFGGPESGNRIMFQHDAPFNTNAGCQPSGEGNDFYGRFAPIPPGVWLRAQEFGLPALFSELAPISGRSHYATFTPRVNIGWHCAPFVVLANTTTGGVSPIQPQLNAALATDGWVNLQIGVTGGPCGLQNFRVYANNNDINNPTSRGGPTDSSCTIPTTAWNGSIAFGGYWGYGSSFPTRFMVDDFEVSGTFDRNFHRAAGTQPGPEPTPTPTPINCVMSQWSAWAASSETACVNGQKNVTESRSRTILTEPANGGLACGPLTETRTTTQGCTMPVPPPVQTCPLRPNEAMVGDVRSVRETVTNSNQLALRVAELEAAGWTIVGAPSGATVLATTRCPRP